MCMCPCVHVHACLCVYARVYAVLCEGTVRDSFPFPDPAAPPKKPPRPGAPGHLGSLASLSSPGDSYNEGVKVGEELALLGALVDELC